MQFEGDAIVLERTRPAEELLYRGERLAGGRFRLVGVGATRDGVTVSIEQPPPPAVGLDCDEIERRISDTDRADNVDVAIEAVGFPDTITQAYALTGPGGRTLIFGLPPEGASVKLSPFDLFFEEREVVGSYSLMPTTFARAVTLLQNGRIDVDTLVTDEFGLEGLETAFEQMEAREGLKKMVYPNQ